MSPLPKPVGFKKENSTSIEMLCCQAVCLAMCLLPLPITQIVYSANNPITCPANTFPFDINFWLYVEATATLLMILNTILMLICSQVFVITHVIGSTFQMAWIIVGAIQFWRDCPTIEPQSVNILMWFTLIAGIMRSMSSANGANFKKIN
jgi:hypothetical protein